MTTPCPKIAYPNADVALRVLQSLIAAGRTERGLYRCARCRHWHLTSAAPNRWMIRAAARAGIRTLPTPRT